MPAHSHGVEVRNEDGNSNLTVAAAFARRDEGGARYGHTGAGDAVAGLLFDAGGGGAHNNMQPSAALNWIIKT
jgi:microcystin-dependent protein